MAEFIHAVIGCGRVAANHADGIAAVEGTTRWACDSDLARARAFAATTGIRQSTADIQDVLGDPAVTSVSIAVDHAQHADLAGAALAAGKHVLLEKPLALTTAAGERLVAAGEQAGLTFSVVSQHRYDPLVRAVFSWIDAGLFGRLLSADVQQQCHRPRSYYTDSYWRGTWSGEGGSALVNQGYHALDVVRSLCGGLSACAAQATHAELGDTIETEDTFAALLRSPQGTLVTFGVTVASAVTWRTRISIVGTAGSVTFDLDHPGTLHFVAGGDELMALAAAERDRFSGEEPPGIGYYGVSHRRQIADFHAAVTSGSPMLVDARAALETLRVIECLYALAETAEPAVDAVPG